MPKTLTQNRWQLATAHAQRQSAQTDAKLAEATKKFNQAREAVEFQKAMLTAQNKNGVKARDQFTYSATLRKQQGWHRRHSIDGVHNIPASYIKATQQHYQATTKTRYGDSSFEPWQLGLIQCLLNLARDISWTRQAYTQATLFTDGFWGETLNQSILSSLCMLITSIAIIGCFKRATGHAPWVETLSYFFGAAAAVYTWNLAQINSQKLLALYTTKSNAAYLSGLATGLAEGPTQYVMITALWRLLASYSRQTQAESFTRKNLLLSIMPGMIPGMVWQLVYNACETHHNDVISTSLYVGFAVMACNALFIAFTSLLEQCTSTTDEGQPLLDVIGDNSNSITKPPRCYSNAGTFTIEDIESAYRANLVKQTSATAETTSMLCGSSRLG